MNRGSSSLSFNYKNNKSDGQDEIGFLINNLNPTSPTFNSNQDDLNLNNKKLQN